MNGISRETFEGMDESSKLNILYDFAKNSHECACRTEEKVVALEKKFDRRKRFDTSISAMAGLVGGASAWLIKWTIGK